MNEMIERVARAVYEARNSGRATVAEWLELPQAVRAEERRDARAAIEAMREPTEGMVQAAHEEAPHIGSVFWWHSWRAMIDAALKD